MRHQTLGMLLLIGAQHIASPPCRAQTPDTRRTQHPYSHVRTDQPRARMLLELGVARSPTVRALIQRVEQSDVVAYITIQPYLNVPTSITRMVTTAAGRRYVLVSLNGHNVEEDLLVLLGHELEHVAEIAGAPEVVDEASLDRFYSRIGTKWRNGLYETQAALAIGRRVRSELLAAATN